MKVSPFKYESGYPVMSGRGLSPHPCRAFLQSTMNHMTRSGRTSPDEPTPDDNSGPSTRCADTPVVLFRADNYASLGMVRSLGRMGVDVYCVDHEAGALATRSKYCSRAYHWDFETAQDEDSVQFLISLAQSLPLKPILIPTFDHRNLLVDRHRARLSEWYILPQPTAGAVPTLYDKRSMHELCITHGVPTPRTAFPTTTPQALAAADSFDFPLVLKALDGDRLMRTKGCRLVVVHDRAELEHHFHRLNDPDEPNLALQEFIPGGLGDATWMLNAYFDRSGRCTFALTGRKLRQMPVNGGMTAMGVCEPCDDLARHMERIVRASGYHGVIDADFIHDRRDGSWKLIDINPRPGATFRLFVDRRGTDCIRALYFDLTGQATPATDPDWTRKWLVEDKDLSSALASLRKKELTFVGWIGSFRGVREVAHIALDDLSPSWAFLKRLAGQQLSGLQRRMRPRHSGV